MRVLFVELCSVFNDHLLARSLTSEDEEPKIVPLAQLVEQLTLNQWVQGSNP